jgi:hypothetical protein
MVNLSIQHVQVISSYTPKVLNSNKWQMASSSHLDKRWLTEKHEDVLEITGISGIFG